MELQKISNIYSCSTILFYFLVEYLFIYINRTKSSTIPKKIKIYQSNLESNYPYDTAGVSI